MRCPLRSGACQTDQQPDQHVTATSEHRQLMSCLESALQQLGASNDPTAVMNLIDFDSRGVLVELQSRSACQQAAREQPELGSSETHQEPTRPPLADASPLRREPCQPARVLRRTSRTSAEDDTPVIFPVLRQESWCVGMSCTWFSVPNCRATPDNRNGSQDLGVEKRWIHVVSFPATMLQEPQQPPRLPRSTAIMLAPIEPVPVWDAVCMTLSSAVEK